MDKISQWMDGELGEHETRAQISRIKQDAELHHSWNLFHLIGDVMRGEHALSREFELRVAARLASEPAVLAPRPHVARRFATYALSAAASVSAVALVAWVAFFNNPLVPQPDLARAPTTPPPVAALSEQLASVPSDGKMNEYLIAHQEFSPSTEIQGLAPYIRGVSGSRQAQ